MAKSPRPNIVFIIADQHRWDFTGYEANGVTHTPNLTVWGKTARSSGRLIAQPRCARLRGKRSPRGATA